MPLALTQPIIMLIFSLNKNTKTKFKRISTYYTNASKLSGMTKEETNG